MPTWAWPSTRPASCTWPDSRTLSRSMRSRRMARSAPSLRGCRQVPDFWPSGTNRQPLSPSPRRSSRPSAGSPCSAWSPGVAASGRPPDFRPRGKDPHKKVYSRKRHLVFDTLGMVVAAVVHAADIQDRGGAKLVLKEILCKSPRLKKCMVDGIDNGGSAEWAKEVGGWILELVVRPEGQKKFEILPWRWIVERTFAWLGRYRCLSRDFERRPESSESWISIAMTHFMTRRLEPV